MEKLSQIEKLKIRHEELNAVLHLGLDSDLENKIQMYMNFNFLILMIILSLCKRMPLT